MGQLTHSEIYFWQDTETNLTKGLLVKMQVQTYKVPFFSQVPIERHNLDIYQPLILLDVSSSDVVKMYMSEQGTVYF